MAMASVPVALAPGPKAMALVPLAEAAGPLLEMLI